MSKLNNIERELNNLESINSFNDKIDSIKKIKKDIKEEEEYINKLLNDLEDDTIIKKSKKNKNLNLDEIIEELNGTSDFNNKISNYHLLNNYIKQLNNELFN
jgi:exonuclease VII small subunit